MMSYLNRSSSVFQMNRQLVTVIKNGKTGRFLNIAAKKEGWYNDYYIFMQERMLTMNKYRKCMAVLICAAILFQPFAVVKAAQTEKEGAAGWEFYNTSLEHKKVTFTIENVEAAQDAIFVIQVKDSSELLELPFSIKNTADKITIDLPEEKYIPAGLCTVYIRDKDNRRTKEKELYGTSHEFLFSEGEAYVKKFVGEDFYGSMAYIKATVGFEEYEGVKDEEGRVTIEYPAQTPGTKIHIECGDDYGCSKTFTYEISDKKAAVPKLKVYRDFININYDFLSSDERVCAEIDGKVYYSEYGRDGWRYTDERLITFPETQNPPEKIVVWVESDRKEDSEKKEYAVLDCELGDCNYQVQAYPSKAAGSVAANKNGQTAQSISTVINGTEYRADIDASGNFVLEYPEQPYGNRLTFTFTDRHGCTYSVTDSVYNSTLGIENFLYVLDMNLLPEKAFADGVPENARLAVEINGTVYRSDWSSAATGKKVTVTYPRQIPGTSIRTWFEMKDSSTTKVESRQIFNRQYTVNADAGVTSIHGKIDTAILGDRFNVTSMYVEIAGQKYPCTLQLVKVEGEDEEDYDLECQFTGTYPQQKVGSAITLVIEDGDGYILPHTIVLNNRKPKLSVSRVNSGSKKVTGTTKGSSDVTVTIGKKTYRAKAARNGKFSVNIKSPRKTGTKFKVSVVTPEGYTTSKTIKVSATDSSIVLNHFVLKSSSSVSLSVSNGKKGDKIALSVGSAKYTKKLKSDKKKQKITVRLRKKGAVGAGIKAVLYDKFGKKKDIVRDMVYFGRSIYRGMSAKNAQLTTWGYPDRKNDWGIGYLQWVYEGNGTTLYVYIRNGVVVSMQRYNY